MIKRFIGWVYVSSKKHKNTATILSRQEGRGVVGVLFSCWPMGGSEAGKLRLVLSAPSSGHIPALVMFAIRPELCMKQEEHEKQGSGKTEMSLIRDTKR